MSACACQTTFAAPIYQQIGADLKSKGYALNYQGVGSGAGAAQFLVGTIDFAGSDPYLTASETKQAEAKGGPVQHFPVGFGAIPVSYNIPGIKGGVKLDGPMIASIFLGKIKFWNDPAITRQNEGLKLPHMAITTAHRSDSSGTTPPFTEVLAAWSPAWKTGSGVDKAVKWPNGTGDKGNEGVAAAVKQTKGAIGYAKLAYAAQQHFTYAQVTLLSTSSAADGLKVPSSLKIDIIDTRNKAGDPIASQTFLIVHKNVCANGLTASNVKGPKNAINYIYGPEQKTIQKLFCAPVPASLKRIALKQLNTLTCKGKAL